ncbi:unnamed protein product, partial [Vitis vinifera]|uniref:Uncharacterized protein n=1 Tax=Vitis vinifera TaxID=29760 RepID=D7U1S9_VITVI
MQHNIASLPTHDSSSPISFHSSIPLLSPGIAMTWRAYRLRITLTCFYLLSLSMVEFQGSLEGLTFYKLGFYLLHYEKSLWPHHSCVEIGFDIGFIISLHWLGIEDVIHESKLNLNHFDSFCPRYIIEGGLAFFKGCRLKDEICKQTLELGEEFVSLLQGVFIWDTLVTGVWRRYIHHLRSLLQSHPAMIAA